MTVSKLRPINLSFARAGGSIGRRHDGHFIAIAFCPVWSLYTSRSDKMTHADVLDMLASGRLQKLVRKDVEQICLVSGLDWPMLNKFMITRIQHQ